MVWVLHPIYVETSQKKVKIRGDTLLAFPLPKLRATGGLCLYCLGFLFALIHTRLVFSILCLHFYPISVAMFFFLC